MIRPDQIPPEALEAAAKAIAKFLHLKWEETEQDQLLDIARATLGAGIAAWPGAEERTSGIHPNGIGGPGEQIARRLILPLPPEGGEG